MHKIGQTTMKTIRVHKFGGPEVLQLDMHVPIPEPNDNQVLIRVYAAGVNPLDTYIRTGTSAIKPDLPYIPGFDCSGMVEAAGKDVKKFKPGDRVFTIKTETGAYAEYTVADEHFVGHLGDHLTFEQGAGVGIPYFTAYKAVVLSGRGKAGETLFVHGASGSVGVACVQVGAAIGMTVIGTAGTAQGTELIKQIGGSCAFNHREEGYMDKVLEATGGEGPDVVVEMLANVNLEKDMNIIKKRGKILIVGSRGKIEIVPGVFTSKQMSVMGVSLFQSSQEEWREMHAGIAAGMKMAWINPRIAQVYDIREGPLVHTDIINCSGAHGRLVIKM